jgi:hypothetical protein
VIGPESAQDSEMPLSHPQAAEVVLAVLSRYVSSPAGKPPGETNNLGLCLEQYGRASILGQNGSPAPLPGLRAVERPPSEGDAMRRIGVTSAEITACWNQRVAQYGTEATLPATWISALVPAELWKVVVAVIRDGPRLAGRRLEVVLATKAAEPAPKNRKRSVGRTSAETLSNYRTSLAALMRRMVEISDHPSGLLTAWTSVPSVQTPRGAPRNVTNTSAPSLTEIRIRARELRQGVCSALSCDPDEVLSTVRTASETRLRGLFRPMRDWAFFSLLVISASRSGAVAGADAVGPRLRQRHFDVSHRTPDGQVGPAIVINPRKRADDSVESWKPLVGPAARHYVAYPLECLVAICERYNGGSLDADWPLFATGSGTLDQAWTRGSIARRFTGQDSAGKRSRAMIPFDIEDPFLGYSPHRYRAAATKMLEGQAAGDYLRRHRIDVPQRFLPDVLTDHSLRGIDAIYNQLNTPVGREEAAAVATEVIAQLVFTELGARRVPDAAGYEEGLRRQQALVGERGRISKDIERGLRSLERGEIDAAAALAQVHRSDHRRDDIAQELARLELDLRSIRSLDPDRFVPIPDDVPSAAHVDFEVIERRVLGRTVPSNGRPQTLEPVRDWIPVSEMAAIAGNSTKQARLWASGRGLPRGDTRRRPWEPDKIPVDDSLGPRRRRILVRGINPEWLDADPHRREKLNELLTDWPAGWSSHFWETHARPPAWMAPAMGQ